MGWGLCLWRADGVDFGWTYKLFQYNCASGHLFFSTLMSTMRGPRKDLICFWATFVKKAEEGILLILDFESGGACKNDVI